jgi:hypothetical protein
MYKRYTLKLTAKHTSNQADQNGEQPCEKNELLKD